MPMILASSEDLDGLSGPKVRAAPALPVVTVVVHLLRSKRRTGAQREGHFACLEFMHADFP
jgi:hypothetical protein